MDQTELQEFKGLIFKVGQEEYGVNINQVVSIERMEPIIIYPNRPAHVLGVTTIRNVVMPVVDIRSALTGETLLPTDVTRIIVVQVFGKEIGLVVDSAKDVLDIAADTIQHPNFLENKNISYLMGISKLVDRLIILLDIERLLENTTNLDELKEIKDAL
jgi:purine-binding chemotaxis protein CheW